MVRKNNCDRLFSLPAKHRPRIWLQPALLAVMSHIQNPAQSLGKMLLASVGALDGDQCEQKPSSAAQLWGNPWNILSSDQGASVASWRQDFASSRISSLALWLFSLGWEGNWGKMAREEPLFPAFLLCLEPLPPGLLSAAVPVSVEHLHRVTSLFPVMDDITKTAAVWCSHLMFW